MNVGMSGVVGLRYEALGVLREAHGIPAADWPEVFDCLQVIERRALDLWREQANRKR
jgi:hypothetical protein